MTYAKTQGLTIVKYPYTFEDLQIENPNTNYGNNWNVAFWFPQTEAGVNASLVEVTFASEPSYDASTQICTQDTLPTLVNNVWTLGWTVTSMTQDQTSSAITAKATTIRSQRNTKLSACDWTQMSDSPVDKATWATYRQSLRDLTNQSGFPFSVVWPTDPAGKQ